MESPYLTAVLQRKLVEVIPIYKLPLQQLDVPQLVLLHLPDLHDRELLIVGGYGILIRLPFEHVHLAVRAGVNIHRGLESLRAILPPPHDDKQA